MKVTFGSEYSTTLSAMDWRNVVKEMTEPPKTIRPHKNKNLTGCQSRLYWGHGVAAKCCLEPGHAGTHHNNSRQWDNDDAAYSAARAGRE